MAHENNQHLLHAYFDGELDLVRSIEFEEHLETCPECASELREQQNIRQSFRTGDLYERAPQNLRTRIRAALPTELQPKIIPVGRRHALEWLAAGRRHLHRRSFGRKSVSEHRWSAANKFAGAGNCREPHTLTSTGPPIRRAIY